MGVEEEMIHLVVENPTEVGVGVVNSQVEVMRLVEEEEEEGSQNLVREHQGLKTYLSSFLFYLMQKNFRPKGYLVPKHTLKTRRKLYVSPKCSSQDF